MIEAENIEKSYGALQVLKGISLTINEGEIISVVGASGAGKSTLLHILGTLDKADKGEVKIAGERISKLSDRELGRFRNKSIGFVFQFHHLLPELNAIENVSLPGWIGKQNEKEVKRKAEELLDYLGLKNRMTHKPNELSGGEQQRVAVARALVNHPKVVLADEPTGNLDSEHARELHQLFFKLRKEFNQTFIIVTHNEELANMADRKMVIKDGKME